MAGFDPRDSTSVERPKEDYRRDLAMPLAGLRVGLPKEYFTNDLAPDVARRPSVSGMAPGALRQGANHRIGDLPSINCADFSDLGTANRYL